MVFVACLARILNPKNITEEKPCENAEGIRLISGCLGCVFTRKKSTVASVGYDYAEWQVRSLLQGEKNMR